MSRKRRGRGEHGLYRRESDGLWVASLSLGYDVNGKRKRRAVYGKTKREAQEKLDRLKQDAAAGMKIEPNKATVKDLLDRWLDLEVKPNRAPGTYRCYSGTAELHITPHIGGVRLASQVELHPQRVRPDRGEGRPLGHPLPRLAALPREPTGRTRHQPEGRSGADRACRREHDAQVLRPPPARGSPGSGRPVRLGIPVCEVRPASGGVICNDSGAILGRLATVRLHFGHRSNAS